jgi:hypothetical protein
MQSKKLSFQHFMQLQRGIGRFSLLRHGCQKQSSRTTGYQFAAAVSSLLAVSKRTRRVGPVAFIRRETPYMSVLTLRP